MVRSDAYIEHDRANYGHDVLTVLKKYAIMNVYKDKTDTRMSSCETEQQQDSNYVDYKVLSQFR